MVAICVSNSWPGRRHPAACRAHRAAAESNACAVDGRLCCRRRIRTASRELPRDEASDGVLDRTCGVLAPALTPSTVTWEERTLSASDETRSSQIPVSTAEAPHYILSVGALAGGRRLLSDDVAMLERVAIMVARRIDAFRLTGERYERMLQERGIRTLATEAELRALRAQINPQFLFNALTTIGYLIQQTSPRGAQDAIGFDHVTRERSSIGR
jgi:hypothetical protein